MIMFLGIYPVFVDGTIFRVLGRDSGVGLEFWAVQDSDIRAFGMIVCAMTGVMF